MTDTLTEEDIERIENSLDIDSMKSERELKTALNKKEKGKNIFNRKLQDFFYNRNKDKIITREDKIRVSRLVSNKGKTIDKNDKITFGIRKGESYYYVRDNKGKIKSYGADKMKAIDYNAEIRRKEDSIKRLEARIENERKKIQELNEAKERKQNTSKE